MKKRSSFTPGIAGGDASPDSKPRQVVIKNPQVNNKISNQEKQLLFLTTNRTSQQNSLKISQTRKRLKGQRFKIRKEPPFYCRSNKIVVLQCDKGAIEKAVVTRIPCNSWTCPDCSFKKALKIKYRLRDIIQLNNLGYFLTLTLAPDRIPNEYKDDTHRYITKLFNHFKTILQRKTFTYYDEKKKMTFTFALKSQEERLKYVWVIEFQKNGNAHLHILLNQYLPIHVLRKVWVHVGGGHSMKILKVKSAIGVSNYIGDYIVKGIKGGSTDKSYGFKFNERRYSVSRSCVKPIFPYKKRAIKATGINLMMILKKFRLEWILYNLWYSEEEKTIIFDKTENKQ